MCPVDDFTYSIIGYGRVGAALDAALNSIGGICTGNFISRDTSKTSDRYPGVHVLESVDELKPADFVFLCVPDDAIQSVSKRLPTEVLSEKKTVVSHVSGSKPSEILNHLTQKSVLTASSHPLMTFKSDSAPSIFKGITVSLEGDPIAIDRLSVLFTNLGSKPIVVTPEQKKLLHLAAVITSNFMSALVFYAADVLKIMDSDPIERAIDILGPLIKQTAENIVNEGFPSALTGPASRGDHSTILEHLELLKKNDIQERIYLELTQQIIYYKTPQ